MSRTFATTMTTPEISMWAYPWDLIDEGAERAAFRLAEIGVESLSVAASYHSGKFISPRSPRRRVYFPEGGVIYFRPDERRFADVPLRPAVSELVNDGGGEPLRLIAESCRKAGLNFVAWVVGTHNTRLGFAHPQFAVKNAFGDTYYHSLCPSHAETRAYVSALVEDVAENYAPAAVEIESCGYMGFRHGYHHEFYGVDLGLLEECLLALCFCPACERLAREANVDFARLRTSVCQKIDQGLDRPPPRDDQHPLKPLARLIGALMSDPELGAFVQARCALVSEFVTSLTEIAHRRGVRLYCDAAVFVKPSSLSWVEGLDVREIGGRVDRFVASLYDESAEAIAEEISYVTGMNLPCEVGSGINVCPPATRDRASLLAVAAAARRAAFRGVGFYNYGMLPEHRLEWVKDAIKLLKDTGP